MCKTYRMTQFALMRFNRKMFLFRFSIAILFLFAFSSLSFAAKIVELHIKGAIGPATADYIVRNIEKEQHADLIIISLDTPGGLDESTRTIIQKNLSSNVPIVTYVSPTGARTASAGTYVLYASTIAAMAPGTKLGAASPVNLSAEGLGGQSSTQKQTTMEKKVTNDAVATIRSLAQLRGRNSLFAEKAVLNAATLMSTEALKEGVINYIAVDDRDLLSQLNGVVVMKNNQSAPRKCTTASS